MNNIPANFKNEVSFFSNPLNGYSNLIDQIFSNTFLPSMNEYSESFHPKVNIKEDEKGYYLDVLASGFKKEDFSVDVLKNNLIIKASSESSEESKEAYVVREFGHSSFERLFKLPKHIDKDQISATYKNGILSISINKVEPKEEEKKSIVIE